MRNLNILYKIFLIFTPKFLIINIIKFIFKKKHLIDYKLIISNKNISGNKKNALISYSYVNKNKIEPYLTSYFNKSVKSIKIINRNNNGPTLICVLKNELQYVISQLEYHRKIGVKHFIYIDNLSNDGTFEFLLKQDDVSLFTVEEKYNGSIKNAWIGQVIDFFGYDKWYLILDADELFIYPGIETKNIHSYINFLEEKGMKSPFLLMVDMYADNKPLNQSIRGHDFFKKYCYFDIDSYKKELQLARQRITGGPRYRLYGYNNTRSKHSLIKISANIIAGTHENHPYFLNFETEGVIGFLLHYKFIFYDEKIRNTESKEDYNVNNSIYNDYKNYFNNYNSTFFYNGTQKLISSYDLLKINLLDKSFFHNFLKNII